LVTFLGETRKVTGSRAAPGKPPQRNSSVASPKTLRISGFPQRRERQLNLITKNTVSISPTAVKAYLQSLQSRIITALEQVDGKPFQTDAWERAPGTSPIDGGGISRILEEGNVLERGGVGFSHVRGKNLPPSAAANRPEIAGRAWEAMGVSLVLHRVTRTRRQCT